MEHLSEDRLRKLIVDNYYGPILVVNHRGDILFSNRPAGSDPRFNVLHKNMYDLAREGVYVNPPTLAALKSGKTEMRYIHREGQAPLVTTSVPVLDENGQVQYVIAYSLREEFTYLLLERIESEKNKAVELLNYFAGAQGKGVKMVCADERMLALMAYARKIAMSDSIVMLTGETGTGKEVFARYIHANSPRAGNVFLPVNCAAIPADLMESEFFGYEKGAFTGARPEGKAGLFELATNGTLFLDEIGELSLMLQSKLLRVLETGEVNRIGSEKSRRVDVRIIAATNRDLYQMVSEGSFREDLYYRLNVIPVEIPPVRERREDIEPLALSFLADLNKKYSTNKYFAPNTVAQLKRYDWPGNVREIRNTVERMYITSASNMLTLQASGLDGHAARPGKEGTGGPAVMAQGSGPLRQAMKEFEKMYIMQTLTECEGNVAEAAEKLDIARSGLYKKLAEYKECEARGLAFTK